MVAQAPLGQLVTRTTLQGLTPAQTRKRESIVTALHNQPPDDELRRIFQELNQPPSNHPDIPRRIQLCRRALELLQRKQNPPLWAKLHVDLAVTLMENSTGEQAENIEQAIQHCQQALEVYTREVFPEQWATTQNNLGNTFVDRIRGEKAENIDQAIYHYKQALEVFTREAFPSDWAMTQNNLGNAYSARIRGERAENIEQAIRHCQQALEVYSRETFSFDWAMTQHNLGNAYLERIRDERAGNIEQAIHHYEQALEVRTREARPFDWAASQNNLGSAYFHRIRGERAENIERAIHHYQQALEVRTREAFPFDWAGTHNNLGSVYSSRIQGKRAENIEQAINHCEVALEVCTREAIPERWATIQNNLGNIYLERIRGERAENIEQAIHHYQQALEIYTREAFPEQWATTQNNLGNTYLERIRGERAENIEQAIRYLQQALEVRIREALPLDWAMTQNNLGNTYSVRIRDERAENIERAIHHYQQALEVYTREAFPEQWATAQNNSGNTYLERIRGERVDNLEQAIRHYQQALEVRTREAFPFDWAMTHSNLGNAYESRILGERAENLERTIYHHQQALEVRTREALPLDWAMTQNNLGNAYLYRIRDERAQNLERAIYHHQQALKVRTREALPLDWAMTQYNLGGAYFQRIRGERAENIEQAIRHYRQALEIYSREAIPYSHRQVQRSLGNLYFGERRWAEALTAYQAAIIAGDELLAAAYSEVGRRAEIGETAQLFANSAYCLLRGGRLGEALLTHDRGKTRLLAQALIGVELEELPNTQRDALQKARQTIRGLEADLRASPENPVRRDDRMLLDLLRTSRAELNVLIDNIRNDHPDFMTTDLAISDILALIPDDGALVAPLVTSQGSAVFVVPHSSKDINDQHVIELDGFRTNELDAILTGTEEQMGWRRHYSVFRDTSEVKTWLVAIEHLSNEIAEALFNSVLERLEGLNVKRVLLMPSGGLQLLPLHIAFIDKYVVSYAPSAYALRVSRRRAAERIGKRAVVVGINAYRESNVSPLQNAVLEAQAVAGLLKTDPLIDSQATKDIITGESMECAYLHLSCHGYFAWGNPLASGLILYDTRLTLAEIIGKVSLDSCRLVTLAACETGIVDVVRQSPDEYIGLPTGFIQAGAPAVVSSLWMVDDRSTALLMERFYWNHLENGMDFATALREAQLWLRDATGVEIVNYYNTFLATRMSQTEIAEHASGFISEGNLDDKPYAHPFYWAAFIYTGA